MIIVCILSSVLIIILLVKVCVIHLTMKEIEKQLPRILSCDTNHLIGISSKDKTLVALTNTLNEELARLRDKRLEYELGNRELRNRILSISHDIRTPLAAIKGYANLLEVSDDEMKKMKYLKHIDKRINELTRLTNELLDYSFLLKKGTEIKKEKLCLNAILETSLCDNYDLITALGIEPRLDICEKRVVRELDKIALDKTLANIFSNILKYSDSHLEVRLLQDGTIEFKNDKSFINEKRESNGLGLSIAKELTVLNGGTLKTFYEDSLFCIVIEFPE